MYLDRNSVGLLQHVLVYSGHLHLVLPALNLSLWDAGIFIFFPPSEARRELTN